MQKIFLKVFSSWDNPPINLILYMFIGPHIAVLIAFLSGMTVIYLHRANIKRIIDHTESKIVLGKKREEKKSDKTDDGE